MSASIIHNLYVKAVQDSLEDPTKSGSLFDTVWEAASPETKQAFADEILKRLATTASISVTGEVSRAIRARVELEIKRVTEQAVSTLNGTIYEKTAQIWESEGIEVIRKSLFECVNRALAPVHKAILGRGEKEKT